MFDAIAQSISNDPVSWMARVYFAAGYDTVRQKRPDRLGISHSPVLDRVSIAFAARTKRSERESHLSPS